MNSPIYGRVILSRYYGLNEYQVLRVYFDGPNGTEYHDIPNKTWTIDNHALQFMALWGFKPSDFDGTEIDLSDEPLALRLTQAPDHVDCEWSLTKGAFVGGETALRNADWFNGDDSSSDDDDDDQMGSGGPSPSTGNRGGVEVENDAESDGLEITVT
jgi:hypothetical protein